MEKKLNLKPKQLTKLFFLLSITVALDALNGAITMYFPGILELAVPILRVFLIIYYLKLLLDLNSNKFLFVAAVSSFFISMILLVSFFNDYQGISFIFEDTMYGIKILNFYVLSTLLFELSYHLDFSWFNGILLTNSYLITLLIIIPTKLNLARQTYSTSNLGSMGFYIANNSTNITLIMLVFFLIYNLWFIKDRKIINFIFFCLSLISLWLQSTKTSLLIIILIIAINIFFFIKFKLFKRSYKISSVFIFFVFFGLLCLFTMLFYQKIDEMITFLFEDFYVRQKYQLQNFSGNKLLFLTSGRFEFLENLFDYLSSRNNVFFWIFGVGISTLRYSYEKITEMDLFDIFFSTGILGVILTYIHTGYLVNKTNFKEFYQKFILFLIILVVGYSIFAGHVYIDIIATTILSIVIASMNSKLIIRKENEDGKL